MKLLYFLADLQRDLKLQESFSRDPALVMKEHGLSPEEQQVVWSQDWERAGVFLAREMSQRLVTMPAPWPTPAGEMEFKPIFPSLGMQGQKVKTTMYLGPKFRSPSSAAGEGGSGLVGEVIKCSLCQDVTPDPHQIPGTEVTFRNEGSSLTVDATFDLAGAPAGGYSIVLVAQSNKVVSLLGAFIITEA